MNDKEKLLMVALAAGLGYVGPFTSCGSGIGCFTKVERLPIKFDPYHNGTDALLVGSLFNMDIEFNQAYVYAASKEAVHRETRVGTDMESSMAALCICVMTIAKEHMKEVT